MTHLVKSDLKLGRSLVFDAIGTSWVITLLSDDTFEKHAQLEADIYQTIEDYDKNYSRFRADSLVTKMAQQKNTYLLPDDAKPLLDTYELLYKLTDGAVTPLIGNVLSDAGYDAEYSLKPKLLRPTLAWDEAIEYNYPYLTIKQPTILDFGAAGKGYLVDIISDLIEQSGVESFYLNAGGDLRYKTVTCEAVRIGLENPDDSTEAIGIASIINRSLCGSAGNRRTWANYTHIIHPGTLRSPTNKKAVWVVSDTTLVSDALTTALLFVSPESLSNHFDFEYAIVQDDYSLITSADFPADFFTI